ncbi:DUF3060 domain-containing protein [Sphingorhabdus arenilitoris]|uniref:DUF3060 domain-containing protein n=1 Tax=Sphingorhabdus arenilitoris TaxID=1490041 RepID=A0ABV8RMB7_9SPHN
MTVKKYLPLLAVTASLFGASAAGANAVVDGANQKMTLDCKGGPAVIDGAYNDVVFTGVCTSLKIDGAYNKIKITLKPGASVFVDGAYNEIMWRSEGKEKPRVSVDGAGNRILRSK